MLLWVLLLDLGLVSRGASTAKKAVVQLSPPWTTIFKGEKVTLTCHKFNSSKPEMTWWYKNQQLQRTWSTNSIQTDEAGKYRCQTQDLVLSDPVNLVVSSDPLILQTPYSVFEGDTLVLRCRRRDKGIKPMAYYKDERKLSDFFENSDLSISIPRAGLNYSGRYHCTEISTYLDILWKTNSRIAKVHVQELFLPPKLKTITSQPIEGTSITLNCDTQIPLEKSDTRLHFSFFRDGKVITSGWKNHQVLQIPAIWKEDSGSYWCEAKAVIQNIWKESNHVKISVKRIPISGILMETQPSGEQLTEGKKLVLNCSIAQGTGNITFSWHREGINASLGEKTQHSLKSNFVLSSVKESDSGKYYCTANNGINTISSQKVNVIVKISKRSKNLAIVGITVALIIIFKLIFVTLVVYHRFQRKSERSSGPIPYRPSPISNLQEPVYSNSPTQTELVPIYVNVNPITENIVYSEVWSTQQEKASKVIPVVGDVVSSEVSSNEHGKEANHTKNPPEDKDCSVIYAEVKKH